MTFSYGTESQWQLNRLACTLNANGAPTLDGDLAAGVWTDTLAEDLPLAAALNRRAGLTGMNRREPMGAANAIAGTTGLGLPAALANIPDANTTLLSAEAYWDAARGGTSGQVVSNLGTAGALLPLSVGSTGSSGLVVSPSGGYVYLPGVAGNYLSVPDANALDTTGDLDVRVKVAMDDWTPSGTQYIAGKYATSNISWWISLNTSGTIAINWSTDGTANTGKASTVATSFADGTAGWIRVTLDVDNGASGNDVKFYTSTDGTNWTQLGLTVTTAGTTSVFSGTANVSVGQINNTGYWPGKIFQAQIFNGINGTKVLDIDCANASTTSSLFTAVTGQTVTINRTGADSNDPKWLEHTGTNYVYLPGVTGNYLSASDEAALDITGDLDIRVRVAMDDWTPGAVQALLAKYVSTGDQRSYRLYVSTDGKLHLAWSPNGTSPSVIDSASSVATSLIDGSAKWIRVTLDVDNGATGNDVKFYLSDDGIMWAQLGTTVTTAGVTSVFAGTAPLEVGSYSTGTFSLAGKMYQAQIFNGINGTTVLDVDTSVLTSGSATSFLATTGQTVTINRSSSGRKTVAVVRPCWLFGTDDYMEVNNRWVDGTTKCVYLPGVAGNYLSVPDSAALDVTGDIDVRVRVALDDWTPAASTWLLSKYNGTVQRSYVLGLTTAGALYFGWSAIGSTLLQATSTANISVADGTPLWVRATLDVDNGASGNDVKFWTSTDGTTFTQLGATVTQAGVTSIFNSTSPLELGTHTLGTAGPAQGRFFRAVIYSDLTSTNKVLDVDTSVVNAVADASFTAVTGQTVTINKSGTGYVSTPIIQSGYVFPTGTANLSASSVSLLDFGATDSFTVVAVARQWGTPTSNGQYVAKKNGGSPFEGWGIKSNGTTLSATANLDDGPNSVSETSGTFTAGTAALLALIEDRTSNLIKIGLNGSLSTGTSSTSVGSATNVWPFRVGNTSGGSSAYQDFEFLGAAIFRRALSALEIQEISNYYARTAR